MVNYITHIIINCNAQSWCKTEYTECRHSHLCHTNRNSYWLNESTHHGQTSLSLRWTYCLPAVLSTKGPSGWHLNHLICWVCNFPELEEQGTTMLKLEPQTSNQIIIWLLFFICQIHNYDLEWNFTMNLSWNNIMEAHSSLHSSVWYFHRLLLHFVTQTSAVQAHFSMFCLTLSHTYWQIPSSHLKPL